MCDAEVEKYTRIYGVAHREGSAFIKYLDLISFQTAGVETKSGHQTHRTAQHLCILN